MYIKRNKNKIFLNELSLNNKINFNQWSILFVSLNLIFILIFLIINLFNLQIVNGNSYLEKSELISKTNKVLIPPRGLIYDSNGNKLVKNIPSYSLYLNPAEIDTNDEGPILEKIALIFNLNKDDLIASYMGEVYKDSKKLNTQRVTIISEVSFDKYIDSLSTIKDIKGIYINTELVREYIDSIYFSHILGYTSDPSQEDVEQGIYPLSKTGKTGIEQQYDNYLRGKEGLEVIEKEYLNNNEVVYVPQQMQYGENVFLSIDYNWQKNFYKIMERQMEAEKAFGSAGVIMNSNTGEIMALVSLPSFDNNMFSKGISYSDYTSLITNPKTPLNNRAIGSQLPPGSSFKIVGATAGLEEGVVTEYEKILSDLCMDLPGDIKFCEADESYIGWVDIKGALEKSSNIYFCNVALRLNAQKQGIYSIKKYADLYGFGLKTGIDLTGEQTGTMASPELKAKLWNEPWYLGDECNAIIGQGLVTVTPLQMTVALSAINNGGDILKPHLLKKIQDQNGNTIIETKKEVIRDINVSDKTLQIIKQGMKQAAATGTAKGLNNLPNNVIAKTGSSDAGEYIQGIYYSGAHSWVIGCFDYENENYCFTILQQWGGRGYKTVPIIKNFLNCLNSNFKSGC